MEMKFGPSEIKKKRGRQTERVKERGSVQVMETESERARERTCP